MRPDRSARRLATALAAVALMGAHAPPSPGAIDPANPTCPAEADWSNLSEMQFTVQEVDGREVLLAEGAIDRNTPSRLQSALATYQGAEIWLRSPGGDALAGNQAGRIIRDNGLMTHIPSGWTCYGTCNFMFMGGIIRSVADGGVFMVAAVPTFSNSEGQSASASEVAQATALLATEDMDYLIRMGISRNLLSEVLYRPGEDGAQRRCLTADELARYNVTSVPLRGSPAESEQQEGREK